MGKEGPAWLGKSVREGGREEEEDGGEREGRKKAGHAEKRGPKKRGSPIERGDFSKMSGTECDPLL